MLHSHGLACVFCCRSLRSVPYRSFLVLTALQVAVSDINKFNFVVEGAETIARSIARFAIFEDLYLHRGTLETKSEKALEEALIRLYATILVYLARVKLYFEQSTASSSSALLCIGSITETLHRTYFKSYREASRGV